jgi:anti-anti-sigma factor
MALRIITRSVGPALVFELHGALDNVTAETLGPLVEKALDGGQRLVVFDLARLDYVSSAGLTIFLTTHRRLKGAGQVRLAALRDPVRQVLNVTGLSLRLDLYPTVEDALAVPAA